jgi:selenocysteine lyase/cysteine desulfurase
MPQQVLDAVVSHLQLEAQIGGYEAATAAEPLVERVYDALASLLNCNREELAIVENATRAWDMAFYAMKFQPGDRILTAVSEYASNYIAFLQVQKSTGVIIEVIPNDEYGQIDVEALKQAINERVRLIAITHVPTNGGLVNPAMQIGDIARSAQIPYLLDACQSIGQMVIDVQEIGCDILTATGRKYLRGPRGTGFLYVSRSSLDKLAPPFLDLHAAEWISRDQYLVRPDARRFENWETNYAGKIGLGVAVDYALQWGLHAIEERVVMLANKLREALTTVPGVVVRDQGRKKCGIVTFTAGEIPASKIQARLALKDINVSVSRRAYSRLDMEARNLNELVRASVHYYNTEEEIERFCLELKQIIKETT